MFREYTCRKCGKKFPERDIKPIRWVIQKYGIKRYRQYATVKHIDLCVNCSNKIIKWVKSGTNDEKNVAKSGEM